MPKTKDGGFILDDSGLAPYGVQKRQKATSKENIPKQQNARLKKKKSK